MTPRQRSWVEVGLLILGILGLLGGIYLYGSGRESGAAAVKERVQALGDSIASERQDRIVADQAIRQDLKDIKDLQLETLRELRGVKR